MENWKKALILGGIGVIDVISILNTPLCNLVPFKMECSGRLSNPDYKKMGFLAGSAIISLYVMSKK